MDLLFVGFSLTTIHLYHTIDEEGRRETGTLPGESGMSGQLFLFLKYNLGDSAAIETQRGVHEFNSSS